MCSSQIDKSKDNQKIIFIDYDGTLACDNSSVSRENLTFLDELKEVGFTRVIATGRNLHSFNKVVGSNFPIDYLIFSCGNGILSFRDKTLLKEHYLDNLVVKNAIDIFSREKIDFMLQKKIPDNHHISFCQINDTNSDFDRRLKIYDGFSETLNLNNLPETVSQIIAIFKERNREKFLDIKEEFNKCNIIRSTSPINHRSLWMEVMPEGVSKGAAAKWLCSYLGIKRSKSISVGNDYNDVDLLEWTSKSFVVNNAPEELLKKYEVIRSNNDSCLKDILLKVL